VQIENVFSQNMPHFRPYFQGFLRSQLPVCLKTNHQFCTTYRGR